MKSRTLHIRHALFLCAFFFGIVGVSWGQVSAGFNTSFVVLSLNSGANTYYDLQASTSNTDFNGASLGSFTAGTNNLLLKGAEHNVYKCGGADLTSTRVYYRIYLTSAGVSGSFTSTDIGYSSGGNNGCGGQDQQWRNLNYSTNLLSGLAPGNYSIQVYSDATITCCGGTALADNSGNNYTATFTVTGNYYSKSTGNLELTSSWGTNTDGTGNVPVNFTTAGNTFNIRNNATPTIGASWTVSGTGSKIVVGDGTNACNFTVPSTFTVTSPTTEVLSNGTLTFEASGALTATTVTNNGSIVMTSGGTLTIAAGGTLTNNATFTGGSGTVSITNAGTINGSGAITFNNLTINGGTLTLTTVPTINGTLQINNGNLSAAPIYTSNSTLLYNMTYSRFNEWSATGIGTIGITPGYPNNVTINSGTFTVLNGDAGTSRAINGTLTIASGATFTTGALNALFTVGGDVVNNGTLTMSTTTGRIKCTNFTNNAGSTTELSTNVGGDLEVTGNLTENENFNSAQRAVFFTGAGTQDIQGSGIFKIDYIVLDKLSGSVRLLSNLLCEGPSGGNAMTLTNSTDILDLNGYTLTLGKATVVSTLSGNGSFKGSSNSSISVLGDGAIGTIRFDQTTAGTTNVLQTFTFNRTSTAATGTATLGENLIVSGNLTVTSGTLTLAASKQLTVSGTLTNNGTFTLENGATFKQGSSVTGGGTYNVKQTLSDGAGSGSTLTGRYWYMGTPVSCARSVGFGSASALNKVWSFTNGAYAAVADATMLSPTTGYVHRRWDNPTLTFSGQNLYATDATLPLSNNAGTYAGWHLIANPYTAYLDWQQVYNASYALSTAISPSYYIRSFNTSGNDVNALITYNSSTGLESNTSSYSLGSTGSITAQHIAPMQAFWVKINPTTPLSATAGQLRLERAFTSHQTGNVGLKNSTVFPTLARVNLVDGARFDQLLVFMNQDMSNAVDQYDSEKMFVSGAPQIYTMAVGKKLVMNGLKNNKKKISVPLYLELPESKVYNLQLAEYILEDGLILLEDKQEGIIQDFTIHDVYPFYANSGVLSNRFVLHFFMPDATITAQGPSNTWVENESSYTEGGNILISSDPKGKIAITLELPEDQKVESSIQVSDANGRIVYNAILEGLTTEFQLNVPSGIYYLTVQSGNLIENKKVFIQE